MRNVRICEAEMFNKFKDDEGNLTSHMSMMYGEDTQEEALTFTSTQILFIYFFLIEAIKFFIAKNKQFAQDTKKFKPLYCYHNRPSQTKVLNKTVTKTADATVLTRVPDTTAQLEWAANCLSSRLSKQVTRALHQPIWKGNPRLEARRYLSI